MYKIVDESILFFSKVSLSKFSLENSQHFVGMRVFIVKYEMECKKPFSAKQGALASYFVTGMSHEFQSPVTRLGPIVLFVL